MNDSLPQLPEYNPHPDLWQRIEVDMITNKQLNRVVQALPDYEPRADLWIAIEHDLSAVKITPERLLWQKSQFHWLRANLVAAATVVIIGTWVFLRPKSSETIRIEYAVEQVDTPVNRGPIHTNAQSSANKRVEEYIARQCADQQAICQRPEVHELRNQLTELTVEQQRIERERQIFGDDPVLVRAQMKIENKRAEVTKELITILRS